MPTLVMVANLIYKLQQEEGFLHSLLDMAVYVSDEI